MKNKLRLIVNWLLVLTMPVWCMPFFIFCMTRDMAEYPDSEFRPVFKEGSKWWWE